MLKKAVLVMSLNEMQKKKNNAKSKEVKKVIIGTPTNTNKLKKLLKYLFKEEWILFFLLFMRM